MHFHFPVRGESHLGLRPETQALLLSGLVDVNATLRDISRQARMLTGATGVAIALAHKQSMICRASVGHAPSLGSRLDITSGFSAECVRTGKALRCDDAETDARVDVAICRRLGIRSILAIPIRVENQIIGLMEVLSSKPGAFGDWHLSLLKRLVNSPLLSNVALIPTSPELLPEIGSASTVVAGKPVEVLSYGQVPALDLPSLPAQFWSDVFVPDTLPWKRFAQSLGLHIVMVATLVSFVRFVVHGPYAVQPKFNSSDVLYYSSSEYFGHKQQRPLVARLKTRRAELRDEPVISVPREQRRRTEQFVAAPDIKLNRDMRTLPAMAWSSVSPPIPGSATMRERFITPTVPVSVVAPPPALSVVGSRPRPGAFGTALIEPPPSVGTASRQVANITIGALQVIGPPPVIVSEEPNSKALATQAGLHDDLATVIAPMPSLKGIHLPSAQGRGRVAVAGAQIVPPPPQVSGAGNSRKQGSVHGELASVVGPSPSLEGVDGAGAQARGRVTVGAAQVVPPPPSVSGRGNSRSWSQSGVEVAVAPPPPSVTDVGGTVRDGVTNRAAISPKLGSLAPTVEGGSGGGELTKPKSNVIPPMETDISDDPPHNDRKELSVTPITPAGALASSSYFASSEIFIAEERLGVQRRRYIKLVYDYLPYQKRLSEYGPNYPQVDKLRATRDVTCDENLTAGVYSLSQAEVQRSGGSETQSQDPAMYQNRLPCFRTTADDYRRALAHPSSKSHRPR